MSKIIDRAGSGIPITPVENDVNLDSLHGINQVIAGATHTVDITDQGDTLEFTNAGAVAVTLDSIATIQGAAHTSDFHVILIATNAATVATITPNGANSFNTGAATIVLTVDEYVILETDSTGLVWNIINSSNARSVGGLTADQFLRSDADDTTTGNITISKATPSLVIKCANEATEATILAFQDETGISRAFIYRPAGVDFLRIDARDSLGASQASLLITEAGKVNVSTGTFQIAGVDVTSTAAELSILDGVTSTAAELNILDGVTSTTAELNITDGDAADSSVTIVDADQLIVNDGGVMKQTAVTDLTTYLTSTFNVSRMVRETAQATTSGTSKSWSSLPSWIKKIDVIFDYVSQSTASAQIYIQIGTGGVATTTGYISNDIIAYDTGDIITNVSATSYYIAALTNNASRLSGAITLYNITGNTWIASGSLVDQIDDESHTIAGRIDIAGTLDFVSIGTTGTAFDNGQANIEYEG